MPAIENKTSKLTGASVALTTIAAVAAEQGYFRSTADLLPGCKSIIGEGDEEQHGQ
jgi:hypothetical protein